MNSDNHPKRIHGVDAGLGRTMTIKDLAAELGLSITTISRALNGYSDVGEKTRTRVVEAAQRLGYRPNRNAQRLVTRRTHNIAWVQPDNERKFLDPHFAEVMAGVLRGARAAKYDIVLSSDTPEHEMGIYDRFVNDNSVDGFIIDLPREDDPRVSYLLAAGRPFVVHGREGRSGDYGWVDIDNYGNFYKLTRLLIANGHRHIAFINGDEQFNYALYRRHAVRDALIDEGLGAEHLSVLNAMHPMGEAGLTLTRQALGDERVTAIIYSSILMAIEGHGAVTESGRPVAVATMDDALHFLELSPVAAQMILVRSSLREAGMALIEELARQCDQAAAPRGTIMASTFRVLPGIDGRGVERDLPTHRLGRV